MRVLIVEDVAESRRWLRELVQGALADCTLTEATDVRQGMALAATARFDLALIDLGLPDGSGLDVLRALHEAHSQTLCVVTTVMGDDAHIVAALSAGANGYLLKEQAPNLFKLQLQQIVAGVPVLSPSIARRLMEHFRRTGPSAKPAETLTEREKDVLGLIGRGMRNAEVAKTLSLSENTIAGYIKDIYRKLGISNRAEASWHAIQLGLSVAPPRRGADAPKK